MAAVVRELGVEHGLSGGRVVCLFHRRELLKVHANIAIHRADLKLELAARRLDLGIALALKLVHEPFPEVLHNLAAHGGRAENLRQPGCDVQHDSVIRVLSSASP
ncbi:hypothetical protein AURDEDRAFT_176569 [Auricularia subglabra TFB-10046 SS5]|uniref:Uncharacterized protein n=1 Tax=Auricularia subglabra (strain TFB-10046 / SS5) TaxID=717982 RepID=J0WR26_AURST|nr:hypothetical protein AURDEDRAFT_176569 [Auricularia subglabra TFB-10046 SS5]